MNCFPHTRDSKQDPYASPRLFKSLKINLFLVQSTSNIAHIQPTTCIHVLLGTDLPIQEI